MSQDPQTIFRPWGHFKILLEAHQHVVKLLHVEPRQALSMQSHAHRSEYWRVLSGIAEVDLDDTKVFLKVDDTITIPQGAHHRLANRGSEALRVLEVQYGDHLAEEDLVRYEDRYGRVLGNRATTNYAELSLPAVICEVGCNHRGEMNTALEMIKVAAQFCHVDVIKFQKRCNRELLSPVGYDAPHPNPINSFGDSYGGHREFLEFDIEEHKILKQACEEWGVVYSTSVWELTSAREVAGIKPQLIKIPSACNTDVAMLDYLFAEYEGEIHVSLGMTMREEEEAVVDLARRRERMGDVVLYHCVSGYPVEDEELYLLEIPRLVDAYKDAKAIGFSGHHRGIAADIAALTLGATFFERHFTFDRTWKGTDHAASLEPDGMRRVARDLRRVRGALKTKPSEIVDVEHEQRQKLKRLVTPAARQSV